MIKQEQITLSGNTYYRTYSTEGYYIQRDGKSYSVAIDSTAQTYTESSTVIPTGGGSEIIDSVLSNTSLRAVQNRVITNAISERANDDEVVHITGDEKVSGRKSFEELYVDKDRVITEVDEATNYDLGLLTKDYVKSSNVLPNSEIGYDSDVCKYIEDLKRSTFDSSKYTNEHFEYQKLTDDGIISGSYGRCYIHAPVLDTATENCKMLIHFTYNAGVGDFSTVDQNIARQWTGSSQIYIIINSSGIVPYFNDYQLQEGQDYYICVENKINENKAVWYFGTSNGLDGGTWEVTKTVENVTTRGAQFFYGYFFGTVHIATSFVYLDDVAYTQNNLHGLGRYTLDLTPGDVTGNFLVNTTPWVYNHNGQSFSKIIYHTRFYIPDELIERVRTIMTLRHTTDNSRVTHVEWMEYNETIFVAGGGFTTVVSISEPMTRGWHDITLEETTTSLKVTLDDKVILDRGGLTLYTVSASNTVTLYDISTAYLDINCPAPAYDLKHTYLIIDGQEVMNFNKTGVDVYKEDIVSKGVNAFTDLDYHVPVTTNSVITVPNETITIGEGDTIIMRSPAFVFYPQKHSKSGVSIADSYIYAHHNVGGEHWPQLSLWINNNSIADYIYYDNTSTGYQSFGTNASLVPGNWYYVETILTQTTAQAKTYSIDGTLVSIGNINTLNRTINILYFSGCPGYGDTRFGYENATNVSTWSAYKNGELVYQPILRIPYYKTTKGTKIVPYEWKSCVDQVREEHGKDYICYDNVEHENFRIIGSPNITDKIAGPFDNTNYIQAPILVKNTDKITVDVTFTLAFNNIVQQVWCSSNNYFRLVVETSNYPSVLIGGAERLGWISSNDCQEGDLIRIIVEIDGDKARFIGYVNGELVSNHQNNVTKSLESSMFRLGAHINQGNESFKGTIHLDKTCVKINDELVWTPYIEPQYTLPNKSTYEQIEGIVENKKADIASCAFPSNKYESLTLPTSGETITAPADGWVQLSKTAGTALAWQVLRNSSNNIQDTKCAVDATNVLTNCIPVSKGDEVYISYTSSGDTQTFRFIYAEGAK